MANSNDSPTTLYPLANITNSFADNTISIPVQTGGEILSNAAASISDTITSPLASAIVVSARDGSQYVIKEIIDISTFNTMDLSLPPCSLTFVLSDTDAVPQIGSMDEIYVYCVDRVKPAEYGINISSPDAFPLENRIFSGLVDTFSEIFDPKIGYAFRIDFTTNIKKFNVTSEFNPNIHTPTFNVGENTSQIPITTFLSFSLGRAYPGDFVLAASGQSNVKVGYVFVPNQILATTGASDTFSLQKLANLPPNQDLIYHDDGYWDPSIYNVGVAVDKYKVLVEFNNKPLKTAFYQYINFIDHDYNTWLKVLADVLEGAFLEMFFSKLGLLYVRQLGMFRTAGDFDYQIDPSIIISYNDSTDDHTIVSKLYTAIDPIQLGQTISPFIFAPPNFAQLEHDYGPRYRPIQVPWAIWSVASQTWVEAAKTDSVQQVNKNQLSAFLSDYAAVYMATQNLNTTHGTCTIQGFSQLDVGQTVLFPHNNRVFYVTSVRHHIVAGETWTTTITLEYGRDKSIDFSAYINSGAVTISQGTFSTSSDNSHNQNPNVIPGSSNISSGRITGGGQTGLGNQCQVWVQDVFGLDVTGADAAGSFDVYQGQELQTSTPLPGDLIYFSRNSVTNSNAGHAGFVNNDGSFTSVLSDGYIYKLDPTQFESLNNVKLLGYIRNPQNNPTPVIHDGPWCGGIANILQSLINPVGTSQTIITQVGNMRLNSDGVYWTDTNYKNDVRKFASELAVNLNARGGDVILFFIAQSIDEVGWDGTRFSGRWNYINIQSGPANGADIETNKANNTVYHFPNLDVAASATADFFNGSNYTDFVKYIQGSGQIFFPAAFDARKAASLLHPGIPGIGFAEDKDYASKISNIFDQLKNKGF